MQCMLAQQMFQYLPSKKYFKIQMPTKALFRMVGVFGVCVWHYVQVQLNDSEWHIGTLPVSQRLVNRLCVFVKVYLCDFVVSFCLSVFFSCVHFCWLVGSDMCPNLVQ